MDRWARRRLRSGTEATATVIFGDIPVSPFDIVIGDDDGLVIVPQALAAKTLESCLAHVAAERKWEAALAHSATTIETFRVPVAIVDA